MLTLERLGRMGEEREAQIITCRDWYLAMREHLKRNPLTKERAEIKARMRALKKACGPFEFDCLVRPFEPMRDWEEVVIVKWPRKKI